MADEFVKGALPPALDANTGEPLNIPYQKLEEALKSGQATLPQGIDISVKRGDGGYRTIPSDQVFEALGEGYSLAPYEHIRERELQKQYGDVPHQALAAAAGAARGVSMSLSDLALAKSGLVNPETLKNLEEANPVTSLASEVVGAVAPAYLSGGTSVVAKGASMLPAGMVSSAGRMIEHGLARVIPVSQEASKLAKVIAATAPKMAGSAVEGSLFAGSNVIHEAALGDPNLTAQSALAQIALGAGFGAGIGIGAAGLEALAGKIAPKFIGKGAQSSAEKAAVMEEAAIAARTGDDVAAKAAEAPKGMPPGSVEELRAQVKDAKFMGMDDIGRPRGDELAQAAERINPRMQFPVDELQIKEAKNPAIAAEVEAIRNGKSEAADLINKRNALQKQELLSMTRKEIEDLGGGKVSYKPEEGGQKLIDSVLLSKTKIEDGLRPVFEAFDEAAPNVRVNKYELLQKVGESFPGFVKDAVIKEDGKFVIPKYSGASGMSKQAYNKFKELFEDRAFGTANEISVAELRNLRNQLEEGVSLTAKGSDKVLREIGTVKADLMDFIEEKMLPHLPEGQESAREAFKNYRLLRENMNYVEKQLRGELEGAAEKAILPEKVLGRVFQDSISAEKFRSIVGDDVYKAALADHLASSMTNLTKDGEFSSAKFGSFLKKNESTFATAFKGMEDKLQSIKDYNTIMRHGPDANYMKEVWQASHSLNLREAPEMYKKIKEFSEGHGIIGGAAKLAGEELEKRSQLNRLNKLMQREAEIGNKAEKVATLKKLEQAKASAQEFISNSVDTFLNKGPEGARRVAVPASVFMFGKSEKERRENLVATINKVNNYATNGAYMSNEIGKATSKIAKHAPETANALAATATSGVMFLADKAPRNPYIGTSMVSSEKNWRPSDAEISKFERYAAAVQSPFSVLTDFAKGVSSKEGFEVLQRVYPEIYFAFTSKLVSGLADLTKDLPYGKRQQIANHVGIPMDLTSTPAFLMAMQGRFASQYEQNNSQPTSGAVNINKSDNFATETEKVLNRS